ncbi:MAG TPA: cell division ATP-binding protein FtsE [Candidatus Pacebacteria bacterium]|nr:cell division ATP-binding protein FtsE [Candidatus Paceibacterota bacterium]
MIYLDKVTKIFSNTHFETVSEVTLNIEKGEFISIVGHSGAGKTTILKLITGELSPTEGKVFFDSVDISKLSRGKQNKYRRNIGTIFQDYRLISNKTVYENIAFAMEVSGRDDKEIQEDVPHVLELVGLTGKEKFFPDELSGGEKQRVAIARAIVNNPDLIIADEPTGNLDPENTEDIIKILEKINSFGTTVILTTHDRTVIKLLNKRVVTLNNGIIISDQKINKTNI